MGKHSFIDTKSLTREQRKRRKVLQSTILNNILQAWGANNGAPLPARHVFESTQQLRPGLVFFTDDRFYRWPALNQIDGK